MQGKPLGEKGMGRRAAAAGDRRLWRTPWHPFGSGLAARVSHEVQQIASSAPVVPKVADKGGTCFSFRQAGTCPTRCQNVAPNLEGRLTASK